MAENLAGILHEQVAAVAPIEGVRLKIRADKATWEVDFLPAATQAEKDAAQTVIDDFDIAAEDAAHAAKEARELKVSGTKLADILIAKGVITEADLG